MSKRKLDELLLEEGLVDEQSLSLARTEAIARQRKLAEIVIDLGLIDQRSLAELLAREAAAELVSPIDTDSAKSVASFIPIHLARRHQIVPVRNEGDRLVMAMIDPFEPGLVELIEAATGLRVERAVGVRSEIEMAVLELYGVDEAGDHTIQLSAGLSLELGPDTAGAYGEYSGIPDEWSSSREEPLASDAADALAAAQRAEADRTAPSTAGYISDAQRLAHLERQILSVSRTLAIIQSRLDTIDARLANLAGQPRVLR